MLTETPERYGEEPLTAALNRKKKLLARDIRYVYHPEFDQRNAKKRILDAIEPAGSPDAEKMQAPPGTRVELQHLYETTLLTREQEQYLFRKMHYLLHCASQLQSSLHSVRRRSAAFDQLETLLDEAESIRNRLVESNLRLVASIARRFARSGDSHQFFELISAGNAHLLQIVVCFDESRGNKFSTYATYALRRHFLREIGKTQTQSRFHPTNPTDLEETVEGNRAPDGRETTQEELSRNVDRLIARLGAGGHGRYQNVLEQRFGLNGFRNAGSQTLKEVGETLGLTRERIRQIQNEGLEELRALIVQRGITEDTLRGY